MCVCVGMRVCVCERERVCLKMRVYDVLLKKCNNQEMKYPSQFFKSEFIPNYTVNNITVKCITINIQYQSLAIIYAISNYYEIGKHHIEVKISK